MLTQETSINHRTTVTYILPTYVGRNVCRIREEFYHAFTSQCGEEISNPMNITRSKEFVVQTLLRAMLLSNHLGALAFRYVHGFFANLHMHGSEAPARRNRERSTLPVNIPIAVNASSVPLMSSAHIYVCLEEKQKVAYVTEFYLRMSIEMPLECKKWKIEFIYLLIFGYFRSAYSVFCEYLTISSAPTQRKVF